MAEENQAKGSSSKLKRHKLGWTKKVLIVAAFFLVILSGLLIYQAENISEQQSRIQVTVLEVSNAGGTITGMEDNFPSELATSPLMKHSGLSYLITQYFPTQFTITGIEFKDTRCVTYLNEQKDDLISLEELYLTNAGINDTNCDFLENYPGLTKIKLLGCQISPDKLIQLIEEGVFRNLKSIDLSYTQADDKLVASLMDELELEELYLNGTQITDKSIKLLEGNQKIQVLELSETQVTDESTKVLDSLKSLRSLDINETNITPEGAQKLRKKFPWLYYKKEISYINEK